MTFVLWLTGWETGREVGVVAAFHLVGLALELFKVRAGSWSDPDAGSYICQAWRRFDLRIGGYGIVAAARPADR